MAHIRRRFGGIVATFDPAEARVLRELVADVGQLLSSRPSPGGERVRDPLADLVGMDLSWENAAGPGEGEAFGEGLERPEDAALARLLPDAYPDDPEASGEFRRLTESSLREGKLAAGRAVLEHLPPEGGTVRLDEETAHLWLGALNDVRVAFGTRLDVTDETSLDVDPHDPAQRLLAVYVWLGFVQQQLVDAATGFRSPF